MKHFHKISIAFCLLLFFSCEKQLDLDPAQSLDSELALKTDQNVKAALVGAYDQMSNVLGRAQLFSELMASGDGETLVANNFDLSYLQMFQKNLTRDNTSVFFLWGESYRGIHICNNVLSAVGVVGSADRGRVEAEALFLRSMAYFELVRFFALPYDPAADNSQLSVPLVLDPARQIEYPGQASVKQVYERVVSDLTKAEAGLPAQNGVFATAGAAAALLSRVYLQMGKFGEARDAANRAIGSGNHSLVPAYADVFNQTATPSEALFTLQVSEQDGINPMVGPFSSKESGCGDGNGLVPILPAHIALYDAADARLKLFCGTMPTAMFSGKWLRYYTNQTLIRLPEMLLVRAECNLRLGQEVGTKPVDDYNAVHARAGLPAAAAVNLDEVLLERRRELAQEGIRFHDIKRMKGTIGTHAWNDCKLVFPVPSRELAANGNLKDGCY